MQRPPPERLVFFFTGITGSGKTQAFRARIRDRFPRRLILDPRDDYEEGVDCELATADWGEVESYLNDWGIEEDRPFSVCFKPVDMDPIDACEKLSAKAWELQDCLLAIDEAHTSCPPPPSNDCPKSFLKCLRMGRKRHISIACLTPRPTQVHTDIRTEALGGETYYFKLTRPDDLKDAANFGGGKEFAQLVARQPKLHGYRIDEAGIWAVRVEFTVDYEQGNGQPVLHELGAIRYFDTEPEPLDSP